MPTPARTRRDTRPRSEGPEDHVVNIRFGGGVHSRSSERDIHPRECTTGENFLLGLNGSELKPREHFDLLGKVPNGGQINGFVSLRTGAGTVSMLVQAGTVVYKWDGSNFTEILTGLSANARLHGGRESTWGLSDVVLVADTALAEVVKVWDGTTLADVAFVKEDLSTSITLYAKYIHVDEERALFANVKSGSETGHLLVGSALGDYTIVSVAQRPSSSLGASDPWYLVAPDNRAINGLTTVFGVIALSTINGDFFKLSGNDATDFKLASLFHGSGALGTHSVAWIGNDVMYGRDGRIERLVDTDRFGDTDANDASLPINNQLSGYNDWNIRYNQRLQRVYCHPVGQNEVWVYFKTIADADQDRVSPWSKYTTTHASQMNPTAMASCFDPSDGLEYVFFGDDDGNVYRMEGTATGDGDGAQNMQTVFESGLVEMPIGDAFRLEGHLGYRGGGDATVTLEFLAAGQSVFNETITVSISDVSRTYVYGGSRYYGGGDAPAYYGNTFEGRLTRFPIDVPGQYEAFQVRVTVESVDRVTLTDIGLRLEAVDP